MTDRILASIELDRNVLRYAETEQSGSAYRLLRLGRCVFDFDLEHALLYQPSDPVLKNVAEALGDALKDTTASELRIVWHGHRALSFFSVVDVDSSPEQMAEQLLGEARHLSGKPSEAVHIVPSPVWHETSSDESVKRYFVVITPKIVYKKLGEIVNALGIPGYRFVGSASAVSNIVRENSPAPGKTGSDLTLAIGQYDGFSEYVLVRDGLLYFTSVFRNKGEERRAVNVQAIVTRLNMNPERIGQLWGYGTDRKEQHPQGTKAKKELKRLDPASFLELEPGGILSEMKLDRFIPCIGGSL